MAEQVIRSDIIQISVDADYGELIKANKEVDDFKKAVTGGLTDGVDDLKKNISGLGKAGAGFVKISADADKTADAIDDLAGDAKKAKAPLDGLGKVSVSPLHNGLTKVDNRLTNIAQKSAAAALSGLKKLAGLSFKGLVAGIGAVGAAVGVSVGAYADYEQLIGGVDTLFKDSSGIVQTYANDAFKTAGLSANKYMETVTGFSANLLQSLGGDTQKAASYANMAVTDMADNANKMGTGMDSIVETYQSLARGNYEMLDNLKLGYGGTKTELQRLIKDAAKLDKSVDANSMSYANLVQAIHVVQTEMGITGTTAKEASSTISGSLASMKSAWKNMMPAFVKGGDDFDQCLNNLVDSALTFSGNVMPAVEKALSGVGLFIERLAPKIADTLPELSEKLIPPLIKSAASLVSGLVKALPSIIRTAASTVADIAGQQFPVIAKIGNFFKSNAESIAGAIKKIVPAVIALAAAFKGFQAVRSITSLFGKKPGGAARGGLFDGLAKINVKGILKGIAAVTVVVVALGALVFAASKVFAGGVNFKELVQVIGLIGILGAVGAALSAFSGLVGMIPIPMVLKGLVNIGLVMAGLGALLFAATKVFSGGVNFAEMKQVVTLIGLLGAVGAGLAVLSGVVGLIPFPMVLMGIASIATVIAGFTAVILAFGKLSEIPGFREFLTTGGDTLALLFSQIGKIFGSGVAGFLQGLTSTLPQIGASIAGFLNAISGGFSGLQGVDLSGVGSFFQSIGAFMVMMAGEKLISFFTGGLDLAKLGTGLTGFVTSAQGFFITVAALPEAGFTKATQLFDALAGMKSLPKDGGVVGWFSGGLDFGKLSDGLKQLSNSNVTGFFNTVAGIDPAGFDRAKQLFDTLSGLKSLPKDGGVAGWFMGGLDFQKISSGLAALSGAAVVGFFAAMAMVNPAGFENAKQLFDTLSSLPKTGGLAQLFTGSVSLAGLGADLGAFASYAMPFFTVMASVEPAKIAALWDGLAQAGRVKTNFAALAQTVKTACTGMVNTVKQTISQIKSAFSSVNLSSSGAQMLNGLIAGMNSRKAAAVSAARSIAQAINLEFDKVQKINSPSKVWEDKGSYMIQGGVIGMKREMPKLQATAQQAGRFSMPYDGSTRGDSYAYTSTRSVENNTVSPVFNLTINANGGDSRTLEQKVKGWVKDAIDDTFDMMSRKSPRLQEI